MLRRLRENNFMVFVLRFAALYVVWGVCRAAFALYNGEITGALSPVDAWHVIRGGFVFDSVSVMYLNGPFMLLSLLPLHLRERRWYRRALGWVYVLPNAAGLLVNVADIIYYPFKLSRIASDDMHFLGEDNFTSLMGTFLGEYWPWLLFWLLCVAALAWTYGFFRYTPRRYRRIHPAAFYAGQTVLLCLAALWGVFAVRGFVPFKGTYPVAMSDATNYVEPRYSSFALSNPFCLIRTMGHKTETPKYFPAGQAAVIAPVIHCPMDSVAVRLEGRPNVVMLVLESFGNAHLRPLNRYWDHDEPSATPNLDRIMENGYVFTNAYHNGSRSIDALPSIWASIPSFRVQFLSLPQSVAEYYPMPAMLRDEGYRTAFFHGAVRESMSFAAFGRMAGVEEFYSREDYEKARGTGDYDGNWGIFDHKFLPFVGGKLEAMRQPFFATVFTLSSHHPYVIPGDVAHMFPERDEPMKRAVEYADYALGEFFREASAQSWYDNTLFIITADHSSLTGNAHYGQPPWNHAVPIVFYMPGGALAGSDDRVMQHINIMPTVMRMLGCRKPFFGFGRDMFNDPGEPFAIYYHNGAFNYVADDMLYMFDGRRVAAAFDFRETTYGEYMDGGADVALDGVDSVRIDHMKAFIEQYYRHVADRDFMWTPGG